ncbi:MAG: DUF1311 domain-containing protein [Endozoicomonadaceae bacterium]|nr:DUF1311 domain-containing protein [Endozoicomonadaceae bacterium]
MYEKIGFVILGGILTVVIYLIKRSIENKPTDEVLDRQKKVLDIHKQMNEQGIGVEELKNLENILSGKTKSIKQHTQELSEQYKPLVQEDDTEFLTQADLNQRANESLIKAQEKLQIVIAGIDARVGDSESQSLLSGQSSWKNYSAHQAEAAASSYEGGSIYPLIYISELESLTNERTARLQVELDEIIRLRGLNP